MVRVGLTQFPAGVGVNDVSEPVAHRPSSSCNELHRNAQGGLPRPCNACSL
ncbi:hypothetical protein [Aminobacter sp. SR38]|uniref:hypothetical protein n=1 Tax=Aminobacter sp. SR38 TaxID=2774562 RepID=UPI00352E8A23